MPLYWDAIDDEDQSVEASSTKSSNVDKTINENLFRDHYSTGSIRSGKGSNSKYVSHRNIFSVFVVIVSEKIVLL